MAECYCNSCPEAVSDVNITQVTIEVDGTESGFVDEYFASTDVVAGHITLSNTPINAAAVLLFLNSGAQGQNTVTPSNQFSVAADVVTLNFTPVAGDVLHFHYLATL